MNRAPTGEMLLPESYLDPKLAAKCRQHGWRVGCKRNGATLLIRPGWQTRQFVNESKALEFLELIHPVKPIPPAASGPLSP